MNPSPLLYLFIGALTCTVGAVPFGLVNLTVVNVAIDSNIRKAMTIAYGATAIEVLFALIALITGKLLENAVNGNNWIKFSVLSVLLVSGLVFWFKKNNASEQKNPRQVYGFLKGALLNLMSIQVLLFWIVGVAFLTVRNFLPSSAVEISFFIAGVGIAKILVLRSYALLGYRVVGKSKIISQNINRIISLMLFAVAFLQFVKM